MNSTGKQKQQQQAVGLTVPLHLVVLAWLLQLTCSRWWAVGNLWLLVAGVLFLQVSHLSCKPLGIGLRHHSMTNNSNAREIVLLVLVEGLLLPVLSAPRLLLLCG
jgi:phosphatidylserine synthase